MAEKEILDALRAELDEGEAELAAALESITAPGAGADIVEAEGQRYTEYLRRFANAADMLEMPALKELTGFLEVNARALVAASGEDRSHDERRELFSAWPSLLRAFLDAPSDPSTLGRLLRRLEDPAWPQPMPEEQAVDLGERLLAEALPEPAAAQGEGEGEETRPSRATPQDVELRFSEDINPQLVDAFLHEAPQHVRRLSQCVERITGSDAATPDDVAQAQRVAHTIKGTANITGVAGIANLTHHMEDILEFLASRGELPPSELGDALVDASDCLEVMIEHLLGLGDPPEQSLTVLQSLLDWANRIDRGEFETRAPAPPASEPAPAVSPVPAAAEAGGVSALRVATRTIDDLLRLAGELATSIVQIQGHHQRSVAQMSALSEQNELLAQRLSALQDLVHVRGVPARRALANVVGGGADGFDPLELDEYSELHSATNAFAEALTDARELAEALREELLSLDGFMTRHEQISSELNNAVLSARLVPVDTIAPRLQRGVRQTCRATGKRARLSILGADMQIDSEILGSVVDPLMHVVRNAVDHGIESPGERVANGKDEHGLIELSFGREGENVVVRCRDDGAGFDFLRIRELAVSQGLITSDRHLSDAELARLTLVPGFTTRRGTTHVSGRGIGMDVVNRSILDLRGTMEIESMPGQGSTITLRVPLTLISMHVLLVRVGSRTFGVPSSTLEQALFSDAGPVVHTDSEWIFRFGDTDYPLRSLASLVGVYGPVVSTLSERVAPLLLIRADTGPTALMVDEAVDGRYLVVKRLGAYVPRVRGVIGASILADGTVAPVLDLRELLREPAAPVIAPEAMPTELVEPAGPNVLVVDDSLSARRTLAQIISDAGFEARTAVDGLDAVEAIEERLPDLVLVDLEMPRMNGLELAKHLRGDEATRDIPLVMITSRSTAKHREQAHAAGIDAFITKPYLEEEVADQIRLLMPVR